MPKIDYNFSITPHDLLASAGKAINAPCVRGTHDTLLQLAAESHARYMATWGQQGHQGWDSRRRVIDDDTSYKELKEICAESWPDQLEVDAACEMFNSWRQSEGHWAAVQTPFTAWGLAMYYNTRKRIWYACGIFGG